jgi:hypothetical protein
MIAALLLTLAAASPGDATAQGPELQEIDFPRFRILTTAAARGTAEALGPKLEEARDLMAHRLGQDYPGLTEVKVGDGAEELDKLFPSAGLQPAQGRAFPEQNLILLDARALRRAGGIGLIRHEVSHVALGQLAHQPLPRWFQEGMAVLEASEWGTSNDLDMVRAGRNPIPLSELQQGFPEDFSDLRLAYSESASFVEFLFEKHGSEAVRRLLARCAQGDSFDAAFKETFGDLPEVEGQWLDSVKVRYTWIPVATGSGTLFALTAMLCLAVYSRVRRQKRLRLSEMALEEHAQAAAERIAAAEQIAPPEPAPEPGSAGAVEKPTLH